MSLSTLQIPTPRAFLPLLDPSRYKGLHGGRGGAKSHFFAGLLVETALMRRGLRAVCVREVQKSLAQSSKLLIQDKIEAFGVGGEFDVQAKMIRTPGDGLIIFEGMHDHTADSIKSLEGYDIAWVEEAQKISKRSLELLRPTIRKPGSELWFSWNPVNETDPVDLLLRGEELPPRAIVREVNYMDNPWFPEDLREEMEDMRARDLEDYAHVWLGAYATKSAAQVLRGRCVSYEFEPQADWDGPYFGADWGFSIDPTALVKVWIKGRELYLEAEAYGKEVDIDDTPSLFHTIKGSDRYAMRADSARPETISYMRRHGFSRCIAADKWPGSVEDGVEHLRSYSKIIIHPRCDNAIREARLWSWKTDRLTGDVMPALKEGNDHTWDAVRYALSPLIKRRGRVPDSQEALKWSRQPARRGYGR